MQPAIKFRRFNFLTCEMHSATHQSVDTTMTVLWIQVRFGCNSSRSSVVSCLLPRTQVYCSPFHRDLEWFNHQSDTPLDVQSFRLSATSSAGNRDKQLIMLLYHQTNPLLSEITHSFRLGNEMSDSLGVSLFVLLM